MANSRNDYLFFDEVIKALNYWSKRDHEIEMLLSEKDEVMTESDVR